MNASDKAAQLYNAPPGLKDRFLDVRSVTQNLCRDLKPEDTVAQSMPEASPVKWHLAHTSWFFETFVIEKAISAYRHFRPEYRELFNSYYNKVGKQYLRPKRGLITRPTLDEVNLYRSHIDHLIVDLLDGPSSLSAELQSAIEVGIHHEQQHQELLLTDLKHLLSFNPIYPVYRPCEESVSVKVLPLQWEVYAGGLCEIGALDNVYSFDNERPRHKVYIQSFEIASRPVTNGEYLTFINDDGYHRPEFWLSDAWSLLNQHHWVAPLYWQCEGDKWFTFTLSGLRELRLDEPVTHISYYEADAYARWAGARLPTEQEWEVAASEHNIQGNFAENAYFHPQPGSAQGIQQLFGDVWEWTQSPYSAYPGFRPASGDMAEYNGKFMCNQWVLRGGSCVTPQSHIRASYRNFFFPDARWQFSGLRLARTLI